jgi:hypothetical protein
VAFGAVASRWSLARHAKGSVQARTQIAPSALAAWPIGRAAGSNAALPGKGRALCRRMPAKDAAAIDAHGEERLALWEPKSRRRCWPSR